MSEKAMYDSMPAVTELNRVEGFDPKSLMREIGDEQNRQIYLDVAVRKLWFRLKYPLGMIHKRIVQMTEQFAIVEARVYLDKGDAEDGFVANAFARRYFSEGEFGPKYLELAETAAVGRALADCGFGSQFADMEGDTDPEQVDAGVSVSEPADGAADKPAASAAAGPVIKQENGVPYQAAPAANPKPAGAPDQPAKPAYTSNMDVPAILSMMTLDDAKNLVIPIGMNKGKKLGAVAIENPKDLKWYIESYRGPDNILRAAATFLVNAAMRDRAAS